MKHPFSNLSGYKFRDSSFLERLKQTFSVFFGDHRLFSNSKKERRLGLVDLTIVPLLNLILKGFIPRKHTGSDATGIREGANAVANFFKWMLSPLWVPLLVATALTRLLLSSLLTLLSSPVVAIVHWSVKADNEVKNTRVQGAKLNLDAEKDLVRIEVIADIRFVIEELRSCGLQTSDYVDTMLQIQDAVQRDSILQTFNVLYDVNTITTPITEEQFHLICKYPDQAELRRRLRESTYNEYGASCVVSSQTISNILNNRNADDTAYNQRVQHTPFFQVDPSPEQAVLPVNNEHQNASRLSGSF